MTLTLTNISILLVGHSERIWCSTVRIIYQSDLDLHPMTLVLKFDLEIVKTPLHTKSEVPMSRHSKVIACTDAHTDRHTDSMKTLPPDICGR